MRLKFKSSIACVTVRSMRKAFLGRLATRKPRITTGRRKGASILSMVTTSPSWLAFHQAHQRTPLETALGENHIASSAARTISKAASKNRVFNDIGWQKRESRSEEHTSELQSHHD